MNAAQTKLNLLDLFKKEISIFLEVSRVLSMSKAAEQLGIAQPGVSKAIRKLETELGMRLLSRNREGVKLTAEGKNLLRVIEQLRDQLMLENLKAQTQHLSIGCHQSVAMEVFPQFIPRLKNLFQQSEMSFKFLTSLQVTEKVSALEIDLGIVINPIKRKQIIVRPIQNDFVAFFVNDSGQHTKGSVLVHPDMIYPSRLKTNERELLQIPDYEVIAEMVKRGNYAGVLPGSIANRHGLIQTGKKLFGVDLSLIFHEDRFDTQTARKILGLLESS